MNGKNEKTFSDLFLNSDDKNDEVTFDSLSDAVDEEKDIKEEKVSFNSFSDIMNTEKKDNNSFSTKEESNNSSNIFNMALNDLNLTEETIDDNTGINNTLVDVDNEKIGEIVKQNEESSLEDTSDDISSLNDVHENIIDEKNDSNIKEVVEETIDSDKEISKTIDSSVFGLGDTSNDNEIDSAFEEREREREAEKIASEMEEANIFGGSSSFVDDSKPKDLDNDETILENSKGKDEKPIVDLKLKKEEENKIKLDSPFFNENNVSDESENPLFSNAISLEVGDSNANTKKGIGKLDLSNTKHFDVKVVPKKESLTKFIVGVISYAFFIWLLLIGITLLVYVLDIKIRAAKGDYSAPVFNAYVVLTGSMLPEIQVNDVVVTKKVDAKDLEVGDIITFASADSRFNGTIITHRIIKKNPSSDAGGITFQTKGDNNNVADSTLVPESNIFGKVILKIPKLGYLQEFLASRGGWIIVILIPCLTVISYDIVKLAKGLKRKKYNNIKVKK